VVGVHPLVYHLPNADIDEDGITDIDEMDPVNSKTDSVQDYVAIYGNNQSMMDSQFNPFIRENSPPVILNVKIKKHDHWGLCFALFIPYPCLKRAWTDVNVEALDVAQYTVTTKLNDDSRRSVTLTAEGHTVLRNCAKHLTLVDENNPKTFLYRPSYSNADEALQALCGGF